MAATSRLTVPFVGRILQALNLKYPALFVLLAALTLVDFLVPDIVPVVDEVGLLLLTMLVGRWKTRHDAPPTGDPAS